MERWTRSSSAESDTLAPEHSSLDRSQPPPSQAVKACCGVAREAEALTIALALLQKGLFRLTGTGGLELEVGELRYNPPPTTPPHRWQLVCPHRGCDMCRFAAATALEKPLVPADGENVHLTTASGSLLSVMQNARLEARRPSARSWETQQWNHHGSCPGPPSLREIRLEPRQLFCGPAEMVEWEEFHDLEAPCVTCRTGFA